MSRHLLVDETKDRDYLLVASGHVSGDLDDLRKLMRGQRRVHMKKESDPPRRCGQPHLPRQTTTHRTSSAAS